MVSPDKVAVCLTCGNEWEVRTAGTGKKRKCPVCGKYRVKMRCELKDDAPVSESKPDTPVDPGSKVVPPADPDLPGGGVPPSVPGDVDLPPREEAEKPAASGGAGFGLILLLAGAGIAVSFLLSRGRWGRAAEVEHYERIPAYPGF